MITNILATAAVFGIVIAIMSIGAVFRNQPIKGSCGGLSALGLKGDCEICGKADECERRKQAREALEDS